MKSFNKRNKSRWYIAIFIIVNLVAIFIIGKKEMSYIDNRLSELSRSTQDNTQAVMQNYIHSFRLFSQMMSHEIEANPNPDDIWNYLKGIDSTMLDIEGDTFDGLYMYYQGRYLYSWDTPYSEYESTGYVATERPWYKSAAAGKGEVVFTPPYMSYANHYILSTISQLQPDGETVFAYDIKMGNIQDLVSSINVYENGQLMIFDSQGTIIGSTDTNYLGGNLYADLKETKKVLEDAEASLKNAVDANADERGKLKEQVQSASSFYDFQTEFEDSFAKLADSKPSPQIIKVGNTRYFGYLQDGGDYNYLFLVPVMSMLNDTIQAWLLPLLVVELMLIYVFARISREMRNQELREAYVELGQTQRRLEIALSAAQKAAAIDDLTGMMNFKSFQKGVNEILESMPPDQRGILIMIDGDKFKTVNDNYGHTVGDEVIKLSAQMIIGRIRTVDLASRLHGDEFAIFVAGTSDYSVAKRIMEDINSTLAAEAARRRMPSITMSSGAIIAKHGDNYTALAKAADEALYRAKETHDGQFASADV